MHVLSIQKLLCSVLKIVQFCTESTEVLRSLYAENFNEIYLNKTSYNNNEYPLNNYLPTWYICVCKGLPPL